MNKTEIEQLKEEVFQANMLLYRYRLAIHTWGNVSGITKDRKYMVIKPSGISYEKMQASDMVVVDLDNNVIDSKWNPSSDTPTHTLLYKADSRILGIVHTHSPYAVAWAQSGKSIPCFGTTHVDNFYGEIPCTRDLNSEEINYNYEHNTGLVILENFHNYGRNFAANNAVLVREHGPFVWSTKNPQDAVNLALTLEEIAKMATYTLIIEPDAQPAKQALQDKHYYRKHGTKAYYGQKK